MRYDPILGLDNAHALPTLFVCLFVLMSVVHRRPLHGDPSPKEAIAYQH